LGRKRRLVRTFEWLTLCPYCGPLPQIAHFLAMFFACSGRGRTGAWRTKANCTIGLE
jgi:hypothetical protein